MCAFKTTLIYLKIPESLDVMQGYGTIAGFVNTLGFYKIRVFCLKR